MLNHSTRGINLVNQYTKNKEENKVINLLEKEPYAPHSDLPSPISFQSLPNFHNSPIPLTPIYRNDFLSLSPLNNYLMPHSVITPPSNHFLYTMMPISQTSFGIAVKRLLRQTNLRLLR